MRFSDIPGNETVKKALVGMADSGRIPHAILMHENKGGGALALALAFLQYLNCDARRPGEGLAMEDGVQSPTGDSCGVCPNCKRNSKLIYPDIHFTFPITTGGNVSGEAKNLVCDMFAEYFRALAVKNPYFLENELYAALGFEKKSGLITKAEGSAILRRLSLSSISDGYRAVVMLFPERMNQDTANMLLKTIEEPPEKTLFILITQSPEDVLQTIASRCLSIRVMPLSEEEVACTLVNQFAVDGDAALLAAGLSGGSVGLALRGIAEGADLSEFRELFENLIRQLVSRDLPATLEVGEALAGLDSREKQKAFCKFAGEKIRKIFLVKQGLESLAGISPDEKDFMEEARKGLGAKFCRKAMASLDRAVMMISRNVSQKIVFNNLVDKLFVSVG